MECIVITLCTLLAMVCGVDIAAISATFDQLLAQKLPTKGTHKTVLGPRRLYDRIAIVGAGPAGVHMAYLLKNAGFTNVHILEKSNRVGGKSLTINHRGFPNDMGTYGLTPDYASVYELIKEYKVSMPVQSTGATIWPNDQCNSSVPFQSWLISSIIRGGDAVSVTDASTKLYQAAFKYISIFNNLFGSFEGELMPRPSDEVLHATRGTILEFLERNNIEILRHLFIQIQTTNGYGYPDKVAALYGFLWTTPVVMSVFLNPAPGQQRVDILDKGWQVLWETMVSEMVKEKKLTIQYNQDVFSIRRTSRYVKIYTRDKRRPQYFDFLITTPSMKNMIDILDTTPKERKIFSRLNPVYFTSTLYDISKGARGLTPFDYYYDNILKKKEFFLTFDRDNYSGIKRFSGPSYKNGETPTGPTDDGLETRVALQLGTAPPNIRNVRDILLTETGNCDDDVTIVTQKSWSYFPRFSPTDVTSGIVWDIFDMQGQHNTWYIGSSVIFESAKSVVDYNKLLMNHFQKPRRCGWWWGRCRPRYRSYRRRSGRRYRYRTHIEVEDIELNS